MRIGTESRTAVDDYGQTVAPARSGHRHGVRYRRQPPWHSGSTNWFILPAMEIPEEHLAIIRLPPYFEILFLSALMRRNFGAKPAIFIAPFQNSESDPGGIFPRNGLYKTNWEFHFLDKKGKCRCPGKRVCSMSTDSRDGYTVVDESRQLKLCEPVSQIPTSDSSLFSGMFTTKQNALSKKRAMSSFYSKKRPDVEEVSTNTLCQCPRGHYCPEHHSQPSVISSPSSFKEEHIRTYSGYCTSELL
ncbi:hypothetical protein TNIN_217491 [Trichonephila inaurata madagascariensis]|uniref:Uncharacterized protein n=1 Tax=Trichonephila inaurata madagascariensis TaxID=2747483 RepID=A0A8X6IGT1_9ARAC|nr:hypothetical protein TNIN_217491 [Trichonephila inaurata madagascariensis]